MSHGKQAPVIAGNDSPASGNVYRIGWSDRAPQSDYRLVDLACANLPVDTLGISIAIAEDRVVEIRFTAPSGAYELYQQLANETLQAFDDQVFATATAAAALSLGYSLALEENTIMAIFQPDP